MTGVVRSARAFALVVFALLSPLAIRAEEEGADSSELEGLRAFLSTEGIEAILYRFTGLGDEVQRWVSFEVAGGESVERPNPAIPNRTLDRAGIERLAALAGRDHLAPGDADFLGHSYALELVADGVPVARLDFHTKGWGRSSLFLIDSKKKRFPDGAVQFLFRGEGRKAWLAALDDLWSAGK